jgi:hypothetical protein
MTYQQFVSVIAGRYHLGREELGLEKHVRQEQFPFSDRVQLTPEIVDFYVARAREERAESMARFGQHVASWVAKTIAHLGRRHRKASSRRIVGSPTA